MSVMKGKRERGRGEGKCWSVCLVSVCSNVMRLGEKGIGERPKGSSLADYGHTNNMPSQDVSSFFVTGTNTARARAMCMCFCVAKSRLTHCLTVCRLRREACSRLTDDAQCGHRKLITAQTMRSGCVKGAQKDGVKALDEKQKRKKEIEKCTCACTGRTHEPEEWMKEGMRFQ